MCTDCTALPDTGFLTSFDAGLEKVKTFTLLGNAIVQILEINAVFQGTGLDQIP